ncbi:MAG: anthranilate synthase component I [Gammaproteobacteria bacterium]|nr:anthranilate synthase component I [Gammaproteobacteria bacterium]
MKAQDFAAYRAAGYNRIPLHCEVLADLDTPLSAYLKLAAGPFSFLFESVQGGERWGRYSIIGLPARTVVQVSGHTARVVTDGAVVETAQPPAPLQWLADFAARYRVPQVPGLPRFTGGLVGYFGYDTVRYVETGLTAAPPNDTLGCADILLVLAEEVLVFDNLSGRLHVVVHVDPGAPDALVRGQARLFELVGRLTAEHARPPPARLSRTVHESDFVSGFPRPEFEAAVARIKAHIIAGDVMQVVLSQRLSIPFSAPPVNLYRALRCLNPSPYMFFLDLDAVKIAGSSPEILVRVEDGEVTVRPIAGTRRRGRDLDEDRALEAELLADPKECAEHLMLIDLGRNDIGRVCETGSVRVSEKMIIERYSHVMHIVSNVTGRMRAGMNAFDVLGATFPAGTVSGAPKVRAMQIVDELEPARRGIYAGAVGYLSWHGNMDTAIAIRTAVIKDRILHVQAGAGIVHDSVPETEWQETMSKARAIFRAVALAEQGIDGAVDTPGGS